MIKGKILFYTFAGFYHADFHVHFFIIFSEPLISTVPTLQSEPINKALIKNKNYI
jgi:hypothetical protein